MKWVLIAQVNSKGSSMSGYCLASDPSNGDTQPSSVARSLVLCLQLPLVPYIVWDCKCAGSSEPLLFTYVVSIIFIWDSSNRCLSHRQEVKAWHVWISALSHQKIYRLTHNIWAWQNQQDELCTQWRLRPAWVATQSDQHLHCALFE